MNINIFNEDCLKGFKELPDESVSVIITSPPYNSGIKYKKYKDNLPEDEYLNWLGEVFEECHRVLEPSGSFFLNISAKPSNQELQFDVINRIRFSVDMEDGMSNRLFYIQNTIHWIKSIYTEDKTFGHVKPINSPKFINPGHEFIIHATKNKDVSVDKLSIGVPYTDKSNIKRWKNKKDIKDRGNTWYLPYKTVQSEKKHPAAFPPQLPEMCMKFHGLDKIKLVLDPFCGEGNTAVACKTLNKDFIGFEIDSEYVNLALEKIK